MANNPFAKVGGFFKAQTAPESPEGRIYNLEKEMNVIAQQQDKLYTDIGRMAIQKFGYADFGEAGAELEALANDMAAKEATVAELKAEIERLAAEAAAAKAAAKAAAAQSSVSATTCPSCGATNPEGYRFCQECGTKLEAPAKNFCAECGAELVAGARFCGVCGAKQPEQQA